jgi:hypothetical protein
MGIKRNSKNRKAGASATRPRKSRKNNPRGVEYPGYCHGEQETARRKRQIEGGKLQCT